VSPPSNDPAQPTGHTPRRILSPRRRITPPASTYPAEPWRLVEKRFSPRYLAQAESLFATSNGYLGIRGTFEEGRPIVQEGTFLNGFYETWPIVYGEEAFGFAKTGQTMLNVTDGSLIKLYVDDEPFDLAGVEIEAYERALDMRSGTLDRSVDWETHDGRHLRVTSRRLVSLEHRHLAAILYEVTVLDASASLTIASQLRTRHDRASSEGDPRRARGFEGQVLHHVRSWAGNRRVLLSLETASSGLVMACGMDHAIETDCHSSEETDCNEESGRAVFLVDAEPGRTVRLVKYLSYHHGKRAEEDELGFRAARTLDRAQSDGFEKILESQERRVSEWWERADVEIEGAPEVQHAVRFNLFQILQASARVEGFGISGTRRCTCCRCSPTRRRRWRRACCATAARCSTRRGGAPPRSTRRGRSSRGAPSTARRRPPTTRPARLSTTSTPTSPGRSAST
jgi:alpha,alpha-trehalose phosphorylase